MAFCDDFPEYEAYRDGPLYYTRVPPILVNPLKNLILQGTRSAQHLQRVCNDLASRIPCEPTQNIGWDWLVNDLDSMLERLARKKKLHKFMDFVSDLARDYGCAEFVEELNTIFQAHNFGYRMIPDDSGCGEMYRWDIRRLPE